jgi:5S rRNA maturation endonuclease (ribonuclease M5)
MAFTARDLLYEEKAEKYRSERELIEQRFSGDEKRIKEEINKLWKPRKYNNSAGDTENGETRVKNRIFHKSSILYNFDLAKKVVPPLYIVEGQADCITIYAAGMRNVCAVSSSSFTREMLELLLRNDPPVKHVIFCLDPDKAGKAGTSRAIKVIEEVFAGNVGMQVDILQMPEGAGDPDKFVRTFGIKSFRDLPRLDLFSWRMAEAVENGEDPTLVADRAVNLIINEPNILRRRRMAKHLATVVCQPEEVIWAEIERRVDSEKAAVEEQKSAVISKMVRDINRSPSRGPALMVEAMAEIELVDKQKRGYDLRSAVSALDLAFERADKNDTRVGIYTGFELMDDWLRGVPKFDKFISVPGKPNAGKSTVFDNIAWRIAEDARNKDVIVVFHTADDSLYERHSRVLGSKFNLASELFETPKFYLEHPELAKEKGVEDFQQVLSRARLWLRGLFEAERLIIADINEVAPTFPALGRYICDVRKRFPDKHIIVLEDNFHLLELPGFGKDSGEAKIAASSHFVKQLCTQQQVTVIATMELPKSALDPGKRPYFTNLKGSGAIPYDINANWSVHNDMADMMDGASVFWEDIEHQQVVQSGGMDYMENAKMPILELIVDKNKISGFKGTIFFRMWPLTGHLEECSIGESEWYRTLLNGTFLTSPPIQ